MHYITNLRVDLGVCLCKLHFEYSYLGILCLEGVWFLKFSNTFIILKYGSISASLKIGRQSANITIIVPILDS